MKQKSMNRRALSVKKWFLALAILVGSGMLATAVAPDESHEVYGSWVMMDLENAGMHIYSTLTIRPDRIAGRIAGFRKVDGFLVENLPGKRPGLAHS